MKIQKLAFLNAFSSSSVFAKNNVTLNKVKLFLQGAELQGQSTVSLTKGENKNLNLSFKLTYPKDKVNDIIGL
ncbi:MAG: hypothetical protein J6574_04510 [Gilliamella sp.]|nr:hypothetical protein [Gilliamella sp.]